MFSLILCCILLSYFTYRYLTHNYDYWRKKNVPFDKPSLIFGNMKDAMTMKRSFSQIIQDLYRKYSDSPYVGFYKMRTPSLLLRDPEIIEQVFVHDLDFFAKNDFTIDPEIDPIAARNPSFQYGQQWKKSRGLFTSMFSNAKIKHHFPHLVQVSKNMIDYIELHKICEGRDLISRYIADASALSAFGVEGESFLKEDAFYRKLAQQLLKGDLFTAMKIMCMSFLPQLAKLLHLQFIPDDTSNYVRQTVLMALKHRKENNVNDNNFLDAIVAMKRGTFNDNDVLARAVGFFIDPHTSNQESYVLYALASNPEVQKKLKIEIDEVLSRHSGEITYDAIQEMSYLDCVISETFRLYPSLHALTKKCTGYYEFPLREGQEEVVSLEPGMLIIVSIIGLHHDEKYFENPKQFFPERFAEKNKGKIPKGVYMPFGLGKRICAGMRFAMILMKISTLAIIKEFEITLNEKTTKPLEMDLKYMMAVPKSGLWINFNRRS